jgi:hypothetical protein
MFLRHEIQSFASQGWADIYTFFTRYISQFHINTPYEMVRQFWESRVDQIRGIYTARVSVIQLSSTRNHRRIQLSSINRYTLSTTIKSNLYNLTTTSNMPQGHLSPLNPLLGVSPNYCAPKQTILCMKEKVWSLPGDTFHIVDENSHEVVQCRGQAFSFSDRKEFPDNHGRPLFSLRIKLLSLHKSFYAEGLGG